MSPQAQLKLRNTGVVLTHGCITDQPTIQGGEFWVSQYVNYTLPLMILLYHYLTELQLVNSLLHQIFPYMFLSAHALL